MKNIFYFFSLVVLLFTSCSKEPDKVLPKKDGKWNYTANTSMYLDGVFISSGTETGTMTFEKSGTVTITSGGASEKGTWSASGDVVKLTIDTETVEFKVIEKSRKSEKWEGKASYVDNGMNFSTTSIVDLSR